MSRLLVDGYNLLFEICRSGPPGDHEAGELIESLRKYKRQKGHSITVVFDGHEGGMPVERKGRVKGIGLVYSRLGERADQVIERFVRKWGGSCVVVTSDSALAASVERDGAVVVGSGEFAERLEMAENFEIKGDGEACGPDVPPVHTRKKGNPKRKSKKERARCRRLKKL